MATTPRCPECGMPVTACKCSSKGGGRFAPMKNMPSKGGMDKGPLKRAPKKQGGGKGRR